MKPSPATTSSKIEAIISVVIIIPMMGNTFLEFFLVNPTIENTRPQIEKIIKIGKKIILMLLISSKKKNIETIDKIKPTIENVLCLLFVIFLPPLLYYKLFFF